MSNLSDKIVFISGASSGIGAATARTFARAGCRLILCARRIDRLAELQLDIPEERRLLLKLDVRNREDVANAIATLPPAWREIQVLVNNAGLAAGRDPLQSGSLDDWEQMIDTNIKGVLFLTRAILPGMVNRNLGHVINIGSIAGHQTYPGGAVYCGTKFAIRAINEALKADLLGTAVRVSSIDPGMVETEFSLVRFKGDRTKADAVYDGMTPLTAEDVAETILYCATRPAHININEILIQSTDQAGAMLVNRRS